VASEPHPREYPVTVRPDLKRLQPQVGIGVKPALVLLCYGVDPAIGRVVGVLPSVDELAVREPRLWWRFLTVEFLVAQTDDLDVLLRNTASPNLRGQEREQCSFRDARADELGGLVVPERQTASKWTTDRVSPISSVRV
jgi:hypothetical protein